MEQNIRFSCPKCGQHLACEPPSLGTQIQCPVCKQGMLVPTQELLESYWLLELRPGTPLPEVKQAHSGRLKACQPDGQPREADAEMKARDLNRAFDLISAYLAGTYAPPRPSPAPRPQPAPKEPAQPPAPPAKRPEPRPAPPAPRAAPAKPAATRGAEPSSRLWWILGGTGVAVLLALIAGVAMFFLQRSGPALSHASTISHWVKAKEFAKREYCHVALVEAEQKGLLRRLGLRINEDFFYEGLEGIAQQKKPEDLDINLGDLCTRLVTENRQGGR